MPNNGDAIKHNLEAIDKLHLPDSYDEEKKEVLRKSWRNEPTLLDAVLELEELFEYLFAYPNVPRSTKEALVEHLKKYQASGTAYAALVGLYMAETLVTLGTLEGLEKLVVGGMHFHPKGIKSAPWEWNK